MNQTSNSTTPNASIVDGIFQSFSVDQVKKIYDDMSVKLEDIEEQILDQFR